MKTIYLDLEFNEITGTTRIVIDFNDDSMSTFELNQAIKDGTLLEEVLVRAAELFGEKVAQDVRDGRIEAICLDNHPELRSSQGGVLINSDQATDERQDIKQ